MDNRYKYTYNEKDQQYWLIAIVLFVSIVLSGCSEKTDERLVIAEKIMEEYPDSSLRILEQMGLPEAMPEHNRHLYNLLITHARYKNFIEDYDETALAEAADYFIEKGNDGEASKALFLKGMIQLESDRLGEAALSFSRGMKLAEDSSDYMWEGQCARGLYMLYGRILDSSAQLKYATAAYDAFSKGGYDDWKDWSRIEIASACNNNRQYKKALDIANEIVEECELSNDTILREESLVVLSLSLFNLGNYSESLHNYAQAYFLNPDVLTNRDKKNISVAISKVDIDTCASEIKNFVNELSSSPDYQPSYVYFANNGNYREAYDDLINYKNEQDRILSSIISSNVSEVIGQFEESLQRLSKEKQKTERIFTWMFVLILISIGIAFYMYHKTQLYKKESQISRLNIDLEGLKNDLQLQIEKAANHSVTANLPAGKPYLNMMREKYSEVNALCDKFYQRTPMDRKSSEDETCQEIKRIIANFTDAGYLKEIEKYVDEISDNLYKSFKQEFYGLSEDKLRIFFYYLLGFSPRSISVFFDQKISAIYNRKSRLKDEIVKSHATRKAEYLKVLA